MGVWGGVRSTQRRELDLLGGASQDEEAQRGAKTRALVGAWGNFYWANRVEIPDDGWRDAGLAAADFAAELENDKKVKAAAKKARLRDSHCKLQREEVGGRHIVNLRVVRGCACMRNWGCRHRGSCLAKKLDLS